MVSSQCWGPLDLAAAMTPLRRCRWSITVCIYLGFSLCQTLNMAHVLSVLGLLPLRWPLLHFTHKKLKLREVHLPRTTMHCGSEAWLQVTTLPLTSHVILSKGLTDPCLALFSCKWKWEQQSWCWSSAWHTDLLFFITMAWGILQQPSPLSYFNGAAHSQGNLRKTCREGETSNHTSATYLQGRTCVIYPIPVQQPFAWTFQPYP